MGLLSQFAKSHPAITKASLGRHTEFFDTYFSLLDSHPAPDTEDLSVTIIARSPTSPAMRALIANSDGLKSRGASVRAIVSQAEPANALRDMAEILLSLAQSRSAENVARWANRSCLLEAHEQLILGRTMCWSGDMMRRKPGKCDGLDLFEENAPQTVRLGNLAFGAIWEICDRLPGTAIRGMLATKTTASAGHPDHSALAAHSFMGHIDRITGTRH